MDAVNLELLEADAKSDPCNDGITQGAGQNGDHLVESFPVARRANI